MLDIDQISELKHQISIDTLVITDLRNKVERWHGLTEQTPQEPPPVVDESLGVLPSIPRGLIKNECECLEALSPMYPRKDPRQGN